MIMEKDKNCAFQFYDGYKVVEDRFSITMEEAKELFNNWYDHLKDCIIQNNEIELAIWINMRNESDYRETSMHVNLCDVYVEDDRIYEKRILQP